MVSEQLLDDGKTKTKKAPLFHPFARRMHMILLLMFGFCCTTFMRLHIAITLTCMINSTAVALLEEQNIEPSTTSVLENVTESYIPEGKCEKVDSSGHHIVVDYGGSLIWTHQQQNFVFSATFWGAMMTCLPAMFIVQRGSPRLVFFCAMLVYVLTSALTPVLATTLGVTATFIIRAVMGLGEGVVLPSINAIIANWFPIEERSTALALFTIGNQLAAAGGTPMAGALCASSLGWPAVFYLAAIAGSIWCVLWIFTSANQPSDCKVMSQKEREYLAARVVTRTKKQRKQKVPYGKMFTSPAFLAQLQAHFVINLVMSLLQLYLPTYLKEVLRLGVVANGAFLVLPNVIMVSFKVSWGLFVDRMKAKGIWSPSTCVKLSQSIANFGCSVALIAIAYVIDCSRPVLALLIFSSMYCCLGAFTSGFYTSLLSIAPRYTATMSSISQFAAMWGRVATPNIVSLVKSSGTLQEWRTLFLIASGISAISGVLFALFGEGEVQHYGQEDPEHEKIAPTIEEEALVLSEKVRSQSILA